MTESREAAIAEVDIQLELADDLDVKFIFDLAGDLLWDGCCWSASAILEVIGTSEQTIMGSVLELTRFGLTSI